MAQQKPVFDPKKSPVALKIANLSDKELFDRYIIKNDGRSLKEEFLNVVSTSDKDNYAIYPNVYSIEGPNLDYILRSIMQECSRFVRQGYRIKSDNFVADIDLILDGFIDEIDRINKDTPLSPVVREVTNYITEEILNNRVLKYLKENLNTRNI